MIISASRRTDIPKFFTEWFMRRVREGFFYSKNPFDPSDVRKISLLPEDVVAIVFWSKDPAPIMKHLDELHSMGYRYYFQFTLNHYPSIFEPNVPPVEERIETFRRLAEKLGPSRVVWRYDPIIVSALTPLAYHAHRLDRIARDLEGYTERLVVSFLDLYGKVRKRLNASVELSHIGLEDITHPERREVLLDFAAVIAQIGASHGMDVRTCAEPVNLSEAGIRPGACIDGELISRLSGKPAYAERLFRKDRSQRRECLCVQSRDMGAYNTCSHGCVYCYANYSPASIGRNLARHSLDSPCMIQQVEWDLS